MPYLDDVADQLRLIVELAQVTWHVRRDSVRRIRTADPACGCVDADRAGSVPAMRCGPERQADFDVSIPALKGRPPSFRFAFTRRSTVAYSRYNAA
ncbi:MAG: hypothetical protein QOJ51_5167 [Acidobacteriaceae bacterium]|jgi:hypothetical protein|nr:hypothetical protein [Acidobacteriaceae bacterium]